MGVVVSHRVPWPRENGRRGHPPKTSLRNSADLAGTCSGGKFVVSRKGEAYDARVRGPNRRFRSKAKIEISHLGWIRTRARGPEATRGHDSTYTQEEKK